MNAAGHAQSRTSVQRESWQQKSSSAEAELPERFLRVAAPSIRFVPWAALASCWPRPQQLLPVSAAGGGRRRCTCRTEVRKAVPLTRDVAHLSSAGKLATKKQFCRSRTAKFAIRGKSALAELRCATGSLQTVLKFFDCRFSLIFRAFPAFCLSVIRCADHKKRPFFIQRQADETHHLLPQTTPLVYCTSLLHKCP